jgi:hypothetical protein
MSHRKQIGRNNRSAEREQRRLEKRQKRLQRRVAETKVQTTLDAISGKPSSDTEPENADTKGLP